MTAIIFLWSLNRTTMPFCNIIMNKGSLTSFSSYFLDEIISLKVQNACTLVPTVFLRHLKTKFEIPFAFSVFLRFPKTKFKLLFLVFHFPTTLENGIPNSIFVFRRHRQLNFNFHFCCTSFYCFTKLMFQSVLWSFRSTARINIGTSFLREKAWKTMAIFWCE